ncbi:MULTISPECIES: tetratricopeptide repeat protein [unclassified Rhizobium]|uniref:tetratricopeptide repeat protein n=1 Tax=unclassified Rhizobium TaxID=2613769 RepID=UPI000CDF4607|nr:MULTISPECIES: tetratricopeptide repeat protein [Rhizobium]AVA19933.1 Flp pilus assembly TadD-like protein [Rhizobium sp. NXC24]MDK4740946.1 tetratricopeptide repeat protein [Rhizobium sp. CNPSo 3464]UWU21245.1 tetratricopeptide repeat protein [Rhizobium tropici]
MATSSTTSTFKTFLLHGASAALMALVLAGCSTTGKDKMTTGSIPTMSKPVDEMNGADLAQATLTLGKAYEANPKDRDTGVNYANALRMSGRNDQALAVMQQVAIAHPDDRGVLAAYGKAQAAAGQLQDALATIDRAQTPDRPDWRLVSAEGAILDQLGRSTEARGKYRDALVLQPNEPTILSNLGMSYVLTGDLKSAETYLRSAAAQPTADSRVRQNLALVVGLQGRFPEAEKIARQELTPQQANANVAYLRSMLAQQNSWQKLAAGDGGKKAVN